MGVHGYDVYFPVLLGLGLGLLLLQNRFEIPVRLQKKMLCVNAFLFLLSFGCVTYVDKISFLGHSLFSGVLIGLTTATLGCSFFLFHSFRSLRTCYAKYGVGGIFPFLATFVLVTYPHVLEQFWPPLSASTAACCGWLLTRFGVPAQLSSTGERFMLWHPHFAASINMGCSGLEGIFFFLFALSVVASFKEKLREPPRFITALIVGLALMFVLNVLRISSFFSFAVFLENKVAQQQGEKFFEWAFHENIGWMLYFSSLFLFFEIFLGKKIWPTRAKKIRETGV
jgi:exosortase/archaeosortase family protein